MLRFGTVNLKSPYKAYGSHGKSIYRIQFNQIDEVLHVYRLQWQIGNTQLGDSTKELFTVARFQIN